MSNWENIEYKEAISGEYYIALSPGFEVRGTMANGMIVEGDINWPLTVLERDGFALWRESEPKETFPKDVPFMFRGGRIAVWRESSLSWSVTGYDRAWGSEDELIKNFGPRYDRLVVEQ